MPAQSPTSSRSGGRTAPSPLRYQARNVKPTYEANRASAATTSSTTGPAVTSTPDRSVGVAAHHVAEPRRQRSRLLGRHRSPQVDERLHPAAAVLNDHAAPHGVGGVLAV